MQPRKNVTQPLFYLILTVSVGLNVYLLSEYWHHKPNWHVNPDCFFCSNTTPQDQPPDHLEEAFFAKVIGFYETLLYYQFGIIGVLLVSCFVYSHFISSRQAREVIDEEIYSDHFREHFRPVIEAIGRKILTELFNNNEFNGVNEKLRKASTRISKLEKLVTAIANDDSQATNGKSSKITDEEGVENGNESQGKVRNSRKKNT
jgi:hypothetical protein